LVVVLFLRPVGVAGESVELSAEGFLDFEDLDEVGEAFAVARGDFVDTDFFVKRFLDYG
jgi:hypothetical protein